MILWDVDDDVGERDDWPVKTPLRKVLFFAVIVSVTFAHTGCLVVRAPLMVARAPVKIYQGVRRHQEHVEAKKWREEQRGTREETRAAAEKDREVGRPWQEQQAPPRGTVPQ